MGVRDRSAISVLDYSVSARSLNGGLLELAPFLGAPTETGHGSYLSIGDLIVVQYSSVGSLSDSIRVLQEPKQL